MTKQLFSINNLNDDCLLEIFYSLPLSTKFNIPLVCKRWNKICKVYNIFNNQFAIGIFIEKNCENHQHKVKENDIIYNYLIKKNKILIKDYDIITNQTDNSSKMFMSRSFLREILIRCNLLKCLSLKFLEIINTDLIRTVTNYCNNLEHLTISFTKFDVSSLIWLDFCNKIGPKLLCLKFEYANNLTDHFISNILKSSPNLIRFTISSNNLELQGYFFQYLANSIKSVSIKSLENFSDDFNLALTSLVSGSGNQIKQLKLKGNLNHQFFYKMVFIQRNFKKIEEIEIGDSIEDKSSLFQRNLGKTIGKIKCLKKVCFNLPNFTPFYVTINCMLKEMIIENNQLNLISFKLNGSEINDKTIEILCSNFTNLEEFQLNQSTCFLKKEFGLTDRIYLQILKLKNLKYLSLVGLHLTDSFLNEILNNCTQIIRFDLRNCKFLTYKSIINLRKFSKFKNNKIIAYIWGTNIDFNQTENFLKFNYPYNLFLSFEKFDQEWMNYEVFENEFNFW